jgi:hypothetical protein
MPNPLRGGPGADDASLVPVYPLAIPTGHFRLDAEDDAMIRATSGGEPGNGEDAHPVFGFIAAIGGLGIPVGDVFTLCGGSIEAGPLLASSDLAFSRPLKVGVTYQVEGIVESVVRKASRRFGAADHIRLRIDVRDGATDYSRLTLTILMPVGVAS